MPKSSANLLTRHTIKALDICGFTAWRQNNGGVYDATKGVYRRNSSTPGISDILGYQRSTGKIIACEIKVGRDKLSPYQEAFLKGIEKSGGYSFVIKTSSDIDCLIKLFRKPALTNTVNILK